MIKRKSIGSEQIRIHHNHHQEILICPAKVIIKPRDAIKSGFIRKWVPIKLCAKLTAKFLMTAYKSKIIKSKLDEDTLHLRISFLTLI